MVMEKKKSGDPDFDDKVPANEQLSPVVTAGDGKPVGRLTQSVGPVDPQGAHLNVQPEKEGEVLDTRPAPGEVAKVKAEVQTYTAEDLPETESFTKDQVNEMPAAVSPESSEEAKVEAPAVVTPAPATGKARTAK